MVIVESPTKGVWYDDGRSNPLSAGRHSLGTRDRDEALRQLPDLDRVCAEDLGLVAKSLHKSEKLVLVTLEEGGRLFSEHVARPQLAGGLKKTS